MLHPSPFSSFLQSLDKHFVKKKFMKFLIMQLTPVSCQLPLKLKYDPSIPFSKPKTFNLWPSLNLIHTNTLLILISVFLDMRCRDSRL